MSVDKIPYYKKPHELKIAPKYFADIWRGFKRFEFRLNDRDYMLGDRLLLREWIEKENRYTGAFLFVEVNYILDCCPIMDDYSCNWVVMQIHVLQKGDRK